MVLNYFPQKTNKKFSVSNLNKVIRTYRCQFYIDLRIQIQIPNSTTQQKLLLFLTPTNPPSPHPLILPPLSSLHQAYQHLNTLPSSVPLSPLQKTTSPIGPPLPPQLHRYHHPHRNPHTHLSPPPHSSADPSSRGPTTGVSSFLPPWWARMTTTRDRR